jgi:maltose O-acetyltransferase
MKSEWDKMVAGELYDPYDPHLVRLRTETRERAWRFNTTADSEERAAVLRELVPHAGADLFVEPPFRCDYGSNISAGRKVYMNFDCVILDVAPVTIGDHCLFGPAVHVYTATHPLDHELRRRQEFAKPVHIGADVWVGGGAIILPGVRIGERTVIGAGSVVTRDIPSDVLAAGNPCRVIRPLRD